MFRGNHPTRVDEKGRLKIPADFKRVVDELYTAQFFITSVNGERAQIWPMPEWQKKEELALNSRDVAVKRWLDRTSYYGQVAEMDAQGRVLIPQVLRESAKTVGDVVVFGKLNYLEVANHDLFRAKLDAEPLTAADEAALAALGL
ncbi:MAG TPA: division/cell wall cluster transcriptional repressor MraZ [Acidobacteriaceae bacterium]|jgi:MraZ protein|nr:division/cell wall cluster transcriptional repressor MraZ [Acidobacteriaceae bacterium]